jgi:uncharacterized membrane protein YkoI
MRRTVLHSAILLTVLATTVIAADLVVDQPTPSPSPLGADQAAEIVRVRTGGRILDVRPVADSGQTSYEVRVLLNEGRVRRVVVDINSGVMQ